VSFVLPQPSVDESRGEQENSRARNLTRSCLGVCGPGAKDKVAASAGDPYADEK